MTRGLGAHLLPDDSDMEIRFLGQVSGSSPSRGSSSGSSREKRIKFESTRDMHILSTDKLAKAVSDGFTGHLEFQKSVENCRIEDRVIDEKRRLEEKESDDLFSHTTTH